LDEVEKPSQRRVVIGNNEIDSEKLVAASKGKTLRDRAFLNNPVLLALKRESPWTESPGDRAFRYFRDTPGSHRFIDYCKRVYAEEFSAKLARKALGQVADLLGIDTATASDLSLETALDELERRSHPASSGEPSSDPSAASPPTDPEATSTGPTTVQQPDGTSAPDLEGDRSLDDCQDEGANRKRQAEDPTTKLADRLLRYKPRAKLQSELVKYMEGRKSETPR
jgi:hypothetical protein